MVKKVTILSDWPEVLAETKTKALAVQEPALIGDWMQVKTLTSEEHYAQADTVLTIAKRLLTQADAERKELVNPLNQVVKKINAKYKAVISPLEDLEMHIKTELMSPYLFDLRAKALKAAEKQAVKEEKKGNEQFADDLRASAAKVEAPATVDGQRVSTTWRARVHDLPALLHELSINPTLRTQINGDLIELLEKRLSAMARSAKAEEAAPAGVTFFSELSISKSI